MDFLSYRERGHIGGPPGKGHIRALDIGGIRRYREISHVCVHSKNQRYANSFQFYAGLNSTDKIPL